jgi:hypothetical protein
MELHEDDPDHFKFALEFIYTQLYDHSAINAITSEDDAFKRVHFVMGLYTIADNYDIARLKSPAANNLKSRLTSWNSDEVLMSVINVHYERCLVPEHGIRKIIAGIMISHYHDFMRTVVFKSLLATFPAFASDIALVCYAEGLFKLRIHYCSCGEELVFREPQASHQDVMTGVCCSCQEKYTYRF